MVNLPLNELKLIAKTRSIKNHIKKSKEVLIKILSKPKTKRSKKILAN